MPSTPFIGVFLGLLEGQRLALLQLDVGHCADDAIGLPERIQHALAFDGDPDVAAVLAAYPIFAVEYRAAAFEMVVELLAHPDDVFLVHQLGPHRGAWRDL